jgi:hypothetical protein
MPYVINPLGRNAINNSVSKGLSEELSLKMNSGSMSIDEFNLVPTFKIDDRDSFEGNPTLDLKMGWGQLIVSQEILETISKKTLNSYAAMSVKGFRGKPHKKNFTLIYIPRSLAVDCIDVEASKLVWHKYSWGEFWNSAVLTHSPILSLRGKNIPDLDIFLAKPYGPKGIYIVSDKFYQEWTKHNWTGATFIRCIVLD